MSTRPLADVFPSGAAPSEGSAHAKYVQERLGEIGSLGTATLSDHVRRHARDRGGRLSYTTDGFGLTWAEFDALADQLAVALISSGLKPRDRVAILYPDGPTVHALYIAAERANLVIVGIGSRAGAMEIRHLFGVSGATALVTAPEHRGAPGSAISDDLRESGLPLTVHLTVDPIAPEHVTVNGVEVQPATDIELGPATGLGDIWMLNSTSGTTGMPKCVVHNQHRWLYFHEHAIKAAGMTSEDVLLGMIPAPYGFGVWTAHTTPILLGATTVLMPRFNAPEATRLISQYKVTTVMCVTTQLIMMLNAPAAETADLSSLTTIFTGGEAIPYQRAAEAEARMGVVLLNIYGSNETGFLSYTTSRDTREKRLTTGGRVEPEMRVRLFDESGEESTTNRGRPGCRGPATSYGYYNNPQANEELFTPDGWMLMGDICEIDDEGYLTVVGRTSDFIIRGGKNVSAAAVEEQVGTHPAVALVAAVAVPDPVFGERVCAVVELNEGFSLTLEELTAHLDALGVSKETWPERLDIVERLPRASGEKIAKGVLKRQYSQV